jgi:hypothetical protein
VQVQRIVVLVVVLLASLTPAAPGAAAQAPGYAEITSPTDGQPLDGLVSIEGSADHPAFLRYDLAFSYDPNPTGTWFPLGEPVDTRARQATLGLWDTSELTPGEYQLRLRVFLEGGAILEDVSTALRVGLPPVAAAPTGVASQPTAALPPEPTLTPSPPLVEASPEPSDPVLLALGIGGFMAAALLLILAAYLPLRRGLALWAGNLRMRRVLRQENRRRRSERDRR